MTIAGLLNAQQLTTGRGVALGPVTDTGDVFGASLVSGYVQAGAGRIQHHELPIRKRNDIIKERFQRDIFEITGTEKPSFAFLSGTQRGKYNMAYEEATKKIDTFISEGRLKDPERFKDIRTTQEITEEAQRISGVTTARMNDVMSRNPSTISKVIGGFGGGMAGVMTDPLNAATMAFGAGEVNLALRGVPLAKAIAKAAAVDGSINAAVEAMQTPEMIRWQKTLGQEYGMKEAAANIALAGAGGFALSGVVRGAIPGIKSASGYTGSVSREIWDKIGASVKLPKSVRDASTYMSRAAHIDEGAPAAILKERRGETENREALKKTIDDIEAYKIPEPQAKISRLESVVTPRGGMEIEVKGTVVELDDLITSDRAEFDQALQPRDRGGRAQSDIRIAEIAAKLDPHQLGQSRLSSLGAPIVGIDNMVESGNGRVMAIARAYEKHPDRAAAYTAFLKEQGFNTAGMKKPVFVRRRISELSPEQRKKFTIDSNEEITDRMSITERAAADAGQLGDDLAQMFEGGDIGLQKNARFARAFIEQIVAPAERNAFITPDKQISMDGIRRLKAALLAKAYGDTDIVTALMEDTDNNIKAIGNVLLELAGDWMRMRADMAAGYVPAALDLTESLVNSVKMIRDARAIGKPIADILGQDSLFIDTSVKQTEELLLRGMFNPTLGRPMSQDKIEEFLRTYMDEAGKAAPGGGLLGEAELTPTDILITALKKQHGAAAVKEMGINTKKPELAEPLHPVYKMTYDQALAEGTRRPKTIDSPNFMSEQRILERVSIAKKLYGEGAAKKERHVELITGLPGAGKSSAVATRLLEERGALLIDSDQAKELLPEYDHGIGAAAVHDESKTIVNMLLDTAIAAGDNIVHPIVGSDEAKLLKLIDNFKKAGYTVGIRLVEVSPKTSIERVKYRFGVEGRPIPLDVIKGYGDKPTGVFYKVIEKESVNEYTHYNNEGAIGKATHQDARVIKQSGEIPVERALRQRRLPGRSNISSGTPQPGKQTGAEVTSLPTKKQIPIKTNDSRIAAKRAELDEMIKTNPDFIVTMEDGSRLNMRQLASQVSDDLDALEAITTCRA